MRQLVTVKTNILAPELIAKMESEGYLIVELPEGESLKIVEVVPAIAGGSLLKASLDAISESGSSVAAMSFVRAMAKAIPCEVTE